MASRVAGHSIAAAATNRPPSRARSRVVAAVPVGRNRERTAAGVMSCWSGHPRTAAYATSARSASSSYEGR
ncbi:hypothetical protein ACFQX7_03510 [Luedemannella flava]